MAKLKPIEYFTAWKKNWSFINPYDVSWPWKQKFVIFTITKFHDLPGFPGGNPEVKDPSEWPWVNKWVKKETQIWPGEVFLPQHVAWDRRVPRGRDLGRRVHWFRIHASHVCHAGVVADVVVHHGGEGWREAETSRGKKGRWFHQVTTENMLHGWLLLQICVQGPEWTHAEVPNMSKYLHWQVNKCQLAGNL